MRHFLLSSFFTLFVTTFFIANIAAPAALQPPDACPAVVQQALDSIGTNCGNMLPNSACYGFNRVSVLFNEAADVDNQSFSIPSDRADITLLDAIETSPLDEAEGFWGLALLNVRANIPDTLPGQSVVFLLMGDARIENQITPEEAVRSAPLTITTSTNARIRSAPDSRANVVTVAAANTTLSADIASQDGAWLRVTLPDPDNADQSIIAWVSREVIAPDAAIDTLARPDLSRMSPMQAFRFSTGIGQPACSEAQGALLIQGPNNIVVDLTVNGARMKVSSTVLLNTTSENKLKVTTLSGAVAVEGYVVPKGYATQIGLDLDGLITGDFDAPERITEEVLDYVESFELLDEDYLNYALDLPDFVDDFDLFDLEDLELGDFEDFDDLDAYLEQFDLEDLDFDFEGDGDEEDEFGDEDPGGDDDGGDDDDGDDDDGGDDDGGDDDGGDDDGGDDDGGDDDGGGDDEGEDDF